ncbi:MAG: helix-turn-helix transcriptional regulator [Rhodobiaceae bacterium]|nr:helix-turn-helix transcriptional regulator [Rhodobiaceae bacterium]MCC0039704.1 helix-turn-helix transcriptional regulator [Brucellaceae bacterium]
MPVRSIVSDATLADRLDWLERAEGAVAALGSDYPDGYRVETHRHSRSQLLYARKGVVMVTTGQGRWMVPPEHAMWLPAGVDHSVEMLGSVTMLSVYVAAGAIEGLSSELRVVGMTPLMHDLIVEATAMDPDAPPDNRGGLVMALILHEIPRLPERPLALPFPTDPRLAAMCRNFLDNPSPHSTIDAWARSAGMSRRSFTRAFLRGAGVSLSTWQRQAILFAALPRLAEGEAVTSVALDLGYESVAAFITMFRKTLGAPPKAWLRET